MPQWRKGQHPHGRGQATRDDRDGDRDEPFDAKTAMGPLSAAAIVPERITRASKTDHGVLPCEAVGCDRAWRHGADDSDIVPAIESFDQPDDGVKAPVLAYRRAGMTSRP
jgi:hypothetical protein